jgi:hypothetical protein
MTSRPSQLLLLLLCACTPRAGVTRQPIPIASLQTTSGQIEKLDAFEARVAVPGMRAELTPPTAAGIELKFVYEGETTQLVPLASGEMRHQLGLKLLSYNTCNVTYVMWRFAPLAQIHVSQKANLGQSRHEECGDRGYREIAASWKSDALPAVVPNKEHRLTAQLERDQLHVSVDGTVVWRGTVPLPAAAGVAPQIGIRSDNARFRFSLSAVPAQ